MVSSLLGTALILFGVGQPAAPDSLVAPLHVDTLAEFEMLIFPPPGATLPLWYQVAWGDGDTLDWSGPLRSPVDISRYHRFRAHGTYEIRVRARDSLNRTSPWSKPLSVIAGEPLLRWAFPTLWPIIASPALDRDGNVYIGDIGDEESDNGEGGRLYCIGPDGQLRWDFETGGSIYGAVTVDGDNVYCVSADSTLYCLDRAGALRWSLRLTDDLSCAPAVGIDGTLYIGSDAGTLFCVSRAGKLRWQFKTGDEIAGPATVGADGRVYITSDSVYCLDARGRRRWAFGTPDADYFFASAVPGPNGLVYCGCTDGYLYCIGPDGRLRWRAPAPDGDEIRTEVVFGESGEIWFGTDGYYLCRMKPGGVPEVMYEAGDILIAPPALSDSGTLYFLPDDGVVYALARSGRLAWTAEIAGGSKEVYYTSAPTIGPDGTVFAASWDGGLFAFRGDAPPARSHWPQYRRDAQHLGRAPKPARRR